MKFSITNHCRCGQDFVIYIKINHTSFDIQNNPCVNDEFRSRAWFYASDDAWRCSGSCCSASSWSTEGWDGSVSSSWPVSTLHEVSCGLPFCHSCRSESSNISLV